MRCAMRRLNGGKPSELDRHFSLHGKRVVVECVERYGLRVQHNVAADPRIEEEVRGKPHVGQMCSR